MNQQSQNYEVFSSNQIEKKATGEYSTSQIPLNAKENNFFQQIKEVNNEKKHNYRMKQVKFQTPFIIETEIESFKEYNLKMCFQEYEEQPIIPLDSSKICCKLKHPLKCIVI